MDKFWQNSHVAMLRHLFLMVFTSSDGSSHWASSAMAVATTAKMVFNMAERSQWGGSERPQQRFDVKKAAE